MNKQRGISNKVLETELRVAIMEIDRHNYGTAKQILLAINDRVKTYLLKKEVPDGKVEGE